MESKNVLKFLCQKLRTSCRGMKTLLSNGLPLRYDSARKILFVTQNSLNWNEKIRLRREVMKNLRLLSPLRVVKLKAITTEYYDRCLEHYLFQRINLSWPNQRTCWFKLAQNNKCIGWVSPEISFDSQEKEKFVDERKRHKPEWEGNIDLLERDDKGFVFLLSNDTFNEDDKILALAESLKGKGFNNLLSSLNPIILGYSTETKRYNIISGRHRVAALRYLMFHGCLPLDLKLNCHIVKYNFESLVYTRPYAEICKVCNKEGGFNFQKVSANLGGEVNE